MLVVTLHYKKPITLVLPDGQKIEIHYRLSRGKSQVRLAFDMSQEVKLQRNGSPSERKI